MLYSISMVFLHISFHHPASKYFNSGHFICCLTFSVNIIYFRQKTNLKCLLKIRRGNDDITVGSKGFYIILDFPFKLVTALQLFLYSLISPVHLASSGSLSSSAKGHLTAAVCFPLPDTSVNPENSYPPLNRHAQPVSSMNCKVQPGSWWLQKHNCVPRYCKKIQSDRIILCNAFNLQGNSNLSHVRSSNFHFYGLSPSLNPSITAPAGATSWAIVTSIP